MAVTSLAQQTVEQILFDGSLRTVFQPIVDLDADGAIVGYEALARGPAGSTLEMPAALFREAETDGLAGELDRACRHLAIEDATAAGLPTAQLLFVNIEPSWLEGGAVLDEPAESRLSDISLVVELTERALAARPSEVLAAVRWLRDRGCRIALDDVGIDHRSLALMPFLSPDIVKLDRSIVQGGRPSGDTARVITAVGAEAERSGAVILAEGIETHEHLVRARSMGARLGQGWLYGTPTSLDRERIPPMRSIQVPEHPTPPPFETTPFELIADSRRLRLGDKRLLLSLSRQLEQEARNFRSEAVVLAAFQDASFFTATTARIYKDLASRAAFVGALGNGLGAEPVKRVRGASIDADDELAGEWDVIVVGPHFAGALVARDLGDCLADMDRRFEFFVSYDRSLVISAAQSLLRRMIRSR